MSIKKNFKSNNLIYSAFGINTLGIILISGASIFMIFKLKSTPSDILPYLIHTAWNNPFDWVYNIIVLGNIFAISGLILLFYTIFLKKR